MRRIKRFVITAGLLALMALSATSAFADTTGYEGKPGNQGGGHAGYEGQPGNQSAN